MTPSDIARVLHRIDGELWWEKSRQRALYDAIRSLLPKEQRKWLYRRATRVPPDIAFEDCQWGLEDDDVIEAVKRGADAKQVVAVLMLIYG